MLQKKVKKKQKRPDSLFYYINVLIHFGYVWLIYTSCARSPHHSICCCCIYEMSGSSGHVEMSDFARRSWANYLARMPQPRMEYNWMIENFSLDHYKQDLLDICASAATTPRVDRDHHNEEVN